MKYQESFLKELEKIGQHRIIYIHPTLRRRESKIEKHLPLIIGSILGAGAIGTAGVLGYKGLKTLRGVSQTAQKTMKSYSGVGKEISKLVKSFSTKPPPAGVKATSKAGRGITKIKAAKNLIRDVKHLFG